MRPIVSTVDALHTNTALPRISGDVVYHTRFCTRHLKMQHIFAYNGLPWGGGYRPVTYILESYRRADVKL